MKTSYSSTKLDPVRNQRRLIKIALALANKDIEFLAVIDFDFENYKSETNKKGITTVTFDGHITKAFYKDPPKPYKGGSFHLEYTVGGDQEMRIEKWEYVVNKK